MQNRHKIKVGQRHFHLPQSRRSRIGVGVAFIVGGTLGFLPVLGFWMIPVGLVILSIDVPYIRRRRRRIVVWWGKRRRDKMTGPTN